MVLPDYQGIGLGRKLLTFVAELYTKQGFDFTITTSAKNLIEQLRKDKHWLMSRYDRVRAQGQTSSVGLSKTLSYKRVTASFVYKS